MGLFFVTLYVFLGVWAAAYLFMRFACYLKAKEVKLEHWLLKLIFDSCESCKEACKSHPKIIARSFLAAVAVAFLVFLVLTFLA